MKISLILSYNSGALLSHSIPYTCVCSAEGSLGAELELAAMAQSQWGHSSKAAVLSSSCW